MRISCIEAPRCCQKIQLTLGQLKGRIVRLFKGVESRFSTLFHKKKPAPAVKTQVAIPTPPVTKATRTLADYPGFVNEGNTCWLATAMQVIIHSPEAHEAFDPEKNPQSDPEKAKQQKAIWSFIQRSKTESGPMNGLEQLRKDLGDLVCKESREPGKAGSTYGILEAILKKFQPSAYFVRYRKLGSQRPYRSALNTYIDFYYPCVPISKAVEEFHTKELSKLKDFEIKFKKKHPQAEFKVTPNGKGKVEIDITRPWTDAEIANMKSNWLEMDPEKAPQYLIYLWGPKKEELEIYDGSQKYRLYAVMEEGGHAYVHIRDGSDWVRFDDSRVTRVAGDSFNWKSGARAIYKKV